MVLSLGKIACEISCCSSPKLSTQQYLNSYFFLFSFIVFCFFPPSDYHCGYLRMDITEEEMGKGLTRGREKNLREQKSSKTKTWDTVQNSLIINLESLKRVGNKKRAIKKKPLWWACQACEGYPILWKPEWSQAFHFLCSSLGPERVYCVGNRPWETGSGEQAACSRWPLPVGCRLGLRGLYGAGQSIGHV